MPGKKLLRGVGLLLLLPALACSVSRQAVEPPPTREQLVFEVQTATPTLAPILPLGDIATYTPEPTATPTLTATVSLTATEQVALVEEAGEEAPPPPPAASPTPPPAPTATPIPAPTVAPLQGGAWDFEEGFTTWLNPYAEICPGSGLANGWTGFTTQDQYGSSCMNQTVWKDNVYTGESAQEITFAYVGTQAGVFRTAPTIPGHQYTVTAYMRREFSPSKVEMSLGLDPTGGTNWQAETVQWFPWREDVDDAWGKTEETIVATGENMTVFLMGTHPYPEPGGTLRLDSVSIADNGPAPQDAE